MSSSTTHPEAIDPQEDPSGGQPAPGEDNSQPAAGHGTEALITNTRAEALPGVMENVEAVVRPLPQAGPRMSHVEISFDLAPGARIQFLVEAAPVSGPKPAAQVQPIVIRAEAVTPSSAAALPAVPLDAPLDQPGSAPVLAEHMPEPAATTTQDLDGDGPRAAEAPDIAASEPTTPGDTAAPAPQPNRPPQLATLGPTIGLAPALARAGHWFQDQRARFLAPAQPVGSDVPSAAAAPASSAMPAEGIRPSWRPELDVRAWSAETRLFSLGLLLCLVTRLWGITNFPIFFHSDEVNNVLLGRHVLENGLRGYDGTWLPIYFEADQNRWSPVLPTYLQLAAALIFGNSVLVARSINALISLGAAVALGLTLKSFFKVRYWWASALLLAMVPSWFLYTRTALETVSAASLFAGLIFFYLLYRCRSPKYIYGALAFGAAAFYAYSSNQLTVLVMAAALLVVDAKYHLENRRIIVRALPVAAILALPAVWFRIQHPTAIMEHLQALNSYWAHAIPLGQKAWQYATTYLYGLSPQYWIPADNGETTVLPSQHFAGQGQLGLLLYGLMLIGLVVSFLKFRASPPHRVLILAALAAPTGAALASIEIARVLVFVIPAVLLATLGLDQLLGLSQRVKYPVAAAAVFGVGVLISLGMLRSALVDGATWSTDYSMSGSQYGIKQIFEDSLPQLLRADPNRQFIVSTGWADNVQMFPEFFLSPAERQRVTFGNVDDYLRQQNALANQTAFVMTAAEYGRVQASAVLTTVTMLKQIDYPDGKPAFYLAQLAYTPDAAAVLAAAQAEASKPLAGTVVIGGQTVRVLYSRLSDGTIQNVFDGDLTTWARGLEANPFVIELHFPQPINLTGLFAKVGSMADFSVTATRLATEGGQPETVTQRFLNQPPDPQVNLAFKAPGPAAVLRIEIKVNSQVGLIQIHIWEIGLH